MGQLESLFDRNEEGPEGEEQGGGGGEMAPDQMQKAKERPKSLMAFGYRNPGYMESESSSKMKPGTKMVEMTTVQSPATGQGTNDGDNTMKMKQKKNESSVMISMEDETDYSMEGNKGSYNVNKLQTLFPASFIGDDGHVMIPESLQPRIKRAAKTAIDVMRYSGNRYKQRCKCSLAETRYFTKSLRIVDPPDDVQMAQYSGKRMFHSFLYPALPRVVEDIWVIYQLVFAITLLVLSSIILERTGVSIILLVLSAVSTLLALIDAYVYFIEMGAIVQRAMAFMKIVSAKFRMKHPEGRSDMRQPCQILPNRYNHAIRKELHAYRRFVTEILVYFLIKTIVVWFVERRAYDRSDSYSIIIYFLLIWILVYAVTVLVVLRTFMVVMALVWVKRLTKYTKGKSYLLYTVRWVWNDLSHMLLQWAVLAMVLAKIFQENCMMSGQNDIRFSPFLWFVAVAGNVFVTLSRCVLFYVVNYPSYKRFSMEFYTDVLTLACDDELTEWMFNENELDEEDKDSLCQVDVVKLRANVIKHSMYYRLQNQLAYLLTNFVVLGTTAAYLVAMVAIFASHAYGYRDPCTGTEFERVLFRNTGITATFFVGAAIFIYVNAKAILIGVIAWACIVSTVAFSVLIPVLLLNLFPIAMIILIIYCSKRRLEA